ncbi:MAG: hypothetical protein ACD_73C00609G0002 [uncultured bacterium]|nr:MAG: hypothetical protein ACD_73C00609G0002 [uncultured bacterium]
MSGPHLLPGGEREMDIRAFIKKIEDSTDDERFALWMIQYRLYFEKKDNLLNWVMDCEDGIIKILFIRFLAKVPEKSSVEILASFLNDKNHIVAEAARKGFEKNHYSAKFMELVIALNTPHESVLYYVVEQIGLNQIDDALFKLIRLLPKASEALLMKIISALRHLAKLDILPNLLPFIQDEREEIRLRVLLVLGALYERGFRRTRKFLLLYLKDPCASVRKTAIWALKKKGGPVAFRIFKKMSLEDESPLVRQEAVTALESYFNPGLVKHLLKIMVHDKDRYVMLRAESVLMEKPFHQLTQGLKKVLKSKDEKAAFKAILLYAASHRDSPEVLRYLLSEYKKAASDQIRVVYIQAIGFLEQSESIPFLQERLADGILISYAAAVSLTKIWRQLGGDYIYSILSEKNLQPLVIQIILKQLTKRDCAPAPDMIAFLAGWLRHDNLNVRYLAGQIVGKSRNIEAFRQIVVAMLAEVDPSNKSSLEKLFLDYLLINPSFLENVLPLFEEKTNDSPYYLSLVGGLKMKPDQAVILLPILFLWAGNRKERFELVGEIVVDWVKKGIMRWLGVLQETFRCDGTHFDEYLLEYIRLSEKYSVFPFETSEINAIRELLEEVGVNDEDLFVRFLSLSRSDLFVSDMVDIISQGNHDFKTLIARKTIKRFIMESNKS